MGKLGFGFSRLVSLPPLLLLFLEGRKKGERGTSVIACDPRRRFFPLFFSQVALGRQIGRGYRPALSVLIRFCGDSSLSLLLLRGAPPRADPPGSSPRPVLFSFFSFPPRQERGRDAVSSAFLPILSFLFS